MTNTITTDDRFFTALWNLPGCLPETDEPLPVFGSYRQAAEYLADHLRGIADQYEEGDPFGDRFASMSDGLTSSIEDGPGSWGPEEDPDGYVYSVQPCEPRGTFTAEESDREDIENRGGVLVSYEEEPDGPTARQVREDVGSIAGSNLEAPADMSTAYAVVDLDRLDEARAELRESGYALDLSYFPTIREQVGDASGLDLFRLSDYGALDLGLYSTFSEGEREREVLKLAGGSVYYGHLDHSSTLERADVVTHSTLVGSDYSGGSVVRSNIATFRKLLDEEDPRLRLDTYGGYGTDGVAVFLDVRTTSGAVGTILEALLGLQDYPCLDEDDLSHREMEEEAEAWENYGAEDYSRALGKVHDLEIEDVDDGLGELFRYRAEHCNANGGPGVIHDTEGPYFLVDEVAKDTPASLLAFLGLVDLDAEEALRLAVDGEGDEARRLSRILTVGRSLRLYVLPALVRGILSEMERRHGPEKVPTERGETTRKSYAEIEAREWILRADVDEGDTVSEIDAGAWEIEVQRIVKVELRRYVSRPTTENRYGYENRTAVVTLDPKRGYLYGPDVDAAVRPLFDSEVSE